MCVCVKEETVCSTGLFSLPTHLVPSIAITTKCVFIGRCAGFFITTVLSILVSCTNFTVAFYRRLRFVVASCTNAPGSFSPVLRVCSACSACAVKQTTGNVHKFAGATHTKKTHRNDRSYFSSVLSSSQFSWSCERVCARVQLLEVEHGSLSARPVETGWQNRRRHKIDTRRAQKMVRGAFASHDIRTEAQKML